MSSKKQGESESESVIVFDDNTFGYTIVDPPKAANPDTNDENPPPEVAASDNEASDNEDNDDTTRNVGDTDVNDAARSVEEDDPKSEARSVDDLEQATGAREVEEHNPLTAGETLAENDKDDDDKKTPIAEAKVDFKTAFLRRFELTIKDPIKRATGIQEFDIYHLLIVIVLVLLLIMIGTVPFMLTTMTDTELGVGYSPLAARFQGDIIPSGGVRKKIWGGKVFKWPRTSQIIQLVLDVNSTEQEINIVDTRSQNTKIIPLIICNSRDGLEIELELIVHLNVLEEDIKSLTQDYGDFSEWFALVGTQVTSSIHNFCQFVNANDYQARRAAVTREMEDFLREALLTRFKAQLQRLALLEIRRPEAFESALVDLENNRSFIALAEAEREAALIQAETILDLADNEAFKIIDTAEVNAELITVRGLNSAIIRGEEILRFAEIFERVKDRNKLNTTEILTFIESNTFAESELVLAVDLPVNLDFKDEL